MKYFILTKAGPHTKGNNSEKDINALVNTIWEAAGRHTNAALYIDEKTPTVTIYKHPIYDEKVKQLIEAFGKFDLSGYGRIIPCDTYITPYTMTRDELEDFPFWQPFTYSFDIQYIDCVHGTTEIRSFTELGEAMINRKLFFGIMVATVLLEYKDHPGIIKFFEKEGEYFRWANNLLKENKTSRSTNVLGGMKSFYITKEQLISILSFLSHDTSYYRIFNDIPTEKSIMKDFFDLFLTLNVSKLALTDSKDPQDWLEVDDEEISDLTIYPKMIYKTKLL